MGQLLNMWNGGKWKYIYYILNIINIRFSIIIIYDNSLHIVQVIQFIKFQSTLIGYIISFCLTKIFDVYVTD